ncbi:hypothetical protein LEP1GSC089_1674 [Leptospira interrogans serovar Autumnalis str. LP101]|nr:hypothetical protein LEP1GSC089_1674 [Leptospira interrogans serovar Autumnalis str. LP101]
MLPNTCLILFKNFLFYRYFDCIEFYKIEYSKFLLQSPVLKQNPGYYYVVLK